eukprot:CAMPEP_0182564212 /NCGR_PEP_ID=MMETSP1324-20130603/6199_1 /TAXON_ID=236786 /ORGANISM="Florenciella sp., Strain RCC1587" /LENGTH=68 /DNA_ID=CAMNT_0024777611 /DNA_START=324 /DNA_END=527 /DNA_ORIENTATION=-
MPRPKSQQALWGPLPVTSTPEPTKRAGRCLRQHYRGFTSGRMDPSGSHRGCCSAPDRQSSGHPASLAP